MLCNKVSFLRRNPHYLRSSISACVFLHFKVPEQCCNQRTIAFLCLKVKLLTCTYSLQWYTPQLHTFSSGYNASLHCSRFKFSQTLFDIAIIITLCNHCRTTSVASVLTYTKVNCLCNQPGNTRTPCIRGAPGFNAILQSKASTHVVKFQQSRNSNLPGGVQRTGVVFLEPRKCESWLAFLGESRDAFRSFEPTLPSTASPSPLAAGAPRSRSSESAKVSKSVLVQKQNQVSFVWLKSSERWIFRKTVVITNSLTTMGQEKNEQHIDNKRRIKKWKASYIWFYSSGDVSTIHNIYGKSSPTKSCACHIKNALSGRERSPVR